jgi:hypothetical protein
MKEFLRLTGKSGDNPPAEGRAPCRLTSFQCSVMPEG